MKRSALLRSALLTALAGAAVVAVVVVAFRPEPAADRASAAGLVAAPVELSGADGPRDLSQVTNEEMEAVIAANPDIVPMRLALVERYLHAGDLEPAHDHAAEAADRASGTADTARALRYLGWTTALLGDPGEGEDLLERSLTLEPGNLDGLWFLANVRYSGLDCPADAAPLLEEILASGVPDETQRALVEAKLEEVEEAEAAP